MYRKIGTIIAPLLLMAAWSAQAADEVQAKALFYNPNTQVTSGTYEGAVQISPDSGGPSVSSSAATGGSTSDHLAYSSKISGYYDRLNNPGISYWIELSRPGTRNLKRVSDRHIFKTGDKIRIHVAANAQGELYVLHKGSSGREKTIPVSSADGASVDMGKDYVVPSNGGWLIFDENKGVEELKFLFAARSQSPGKPQKANMDVPTLYAMHQRYSVSKGLVSSVEQGTKDLLVAGADSHVGYDYPVNRNSDRIMPVSQELAQAPGHYAVNVQGDPVAVMVQLRHQ